MARMFRILGVKDGIETPVTTISSAAEGKAAHAEMKAEGVYDYIRCRDCLGGLRFEFDLKTGRKTA